MIEMKEERKRIGEESSQRRYQTRGRISSEAGETTKGHGKIIRRKEILEELDDLDAQLPSTTRSRVKGMLMKRHHK